jgi:hypothetical protein
MVTIIDIDIRSTICATIWLSVIFILGFLLFRYTVIGLDRGEYDKAKTWTLIGAIVGLLGGIIPFIVFIISYVSFDDAVQTYQMDKTLYENTQKQTQIRFCSGCRRKIPFDSRLCPYCGVRTSPTHPLRKTRPLPPR